MEVLGLFFINQSIHEGFIDNIKNSYNEYKFVNTPVRKISKPAVEKFYDEPPKEEYNHFLDEVEIASRSFMNLWERYADDPVQKTVYKEFKSVKKPAFENYFEAVGSRGNGLYAIHSVAPIYLDFIKYSKEAMKLYEYYRKNGYISGSYAGATEYDIIYRYVTGIMGEVAYRLEREIKRAHFDNHFYVEAYSMQATRGEERTRFAYMALVCMYKMMPKGSVEYKYMMPVNGKERDQVYSMRPDFRGERDRGRVELVDFYNKNKDYASIF